MRRGEKILSRGMLPTAVNDVGILLTWQRNRQEGWGEAFAPDRVQVTVNKHIAEPYTPLENGEVVAFAPRPQ